MNITNRVSEFKGEPQSILILRTPLLLQVYHFRTRVQMVIAVFLFTERT